MKFKQVVFFFHFSLLVLTFSSQLIELQNQITKLQIRTQFINNYRYLQQKYLEDHSTQFAQIQESPQLLYTSKCNFSTTPAHSHFFQTSIDIYFTVYLQHSKQTKIYNSLCQQISSLSNIAIKRVLTDRGQIQSGVVYFITADDSLYHFYQQSNFSYPLKISNLKTSHKIVNGIVRYKGKQRIEIFICYENGMIKIYDESGTNKLSLQLQGLNSQVLMVLDRHPYPIFVSKSNWLSMLDTSKYLQIEQNCPHIPNIKYILPENIYGQSIFIITNEKVYLINIETGKKQCTIKRQYNLFASIDQINHVSFYSNSLFIDNKIFNLTERKLYESSNCKGMQSYQFISKKNQPNSNYCLKKCCSADQCSLQFSQVKKLTEDKNIFIWLTISFIIVIFVSLSFIKKSNINSFEISQSSPGPQIVDRHLYQLSKKHRQNHNKMKNK